jgi:hypothetical protein
MLRTSHAERAEHAEHGLTLRFLRILHAIVVIATLASPAAAQTVNPPEISAGYAAVNDPKSETVFRTGWMVGAAVPLTSWLSLVGDGGGNYATVTGFASDTSLSLYSITSGLRASTKLGRIVEFAQLQAGYFRESGSRFGITETNSSRILQPGFGIDFPLRGRVTARGEIDVRFIKARPGGNEPGYHVRFVAAGVYRLR